RSHLGLKPRLLECHRPQGLRAIDWRALAARFALALRPLNLLQIVERDVPSSRPRPGTSGDQSEVVPVIKRQRIRFRRRGKLHRSEKTCVIAEASHRFIPPVICAQYGRMRRRPTNIGCSRGGIAAVNACELSTATEY